MDHLAIWITAALTILLIIIRPRKIPEAVWAASGAVLLVGFRQISARDALAAITRGADVYMFLGGMMILAELAHREGVFDWIAGLAVKRAHGSAKRLFAIIYMAGTIVTIFLSNDATAVVLTPAVLAVVRKVRAKPLPYLLICALVANAASFVLPISNPANLVIYGSEMPPPATWLKWFGLSSLTSIAVTFLVLRFACSNDLGGRIGDAVGDASLSDAGRRAAYGIAGTSVALILASAFNVGLGLATLAAAVVVTALLAYNDRDAPLGIAKDISWSVLPLVASLFVLAAAVDRAGALTVSHAALVHVTALSPLGGSLSSAFGVALLCNVANNLPVALLTGSAIHAGAISLAIKNALLIGVDLGPNLSVSGSLATILWLLAIRREGEDVSFWKFLGYGLLVMPPALVLSVVASVMNAG